MIAIGIDPSYTNCGVSDGLEHIVVQSKPEGDDAVGNIKRRSREIMTGIARFIGARSCHIFVEGPMVSARGAMHLYELGWLMNDLHTLLPVTRAGQGIVAIHQVPIATLRKWVTGKGNAPKDVMKLRVFQRWGIEFEKDPGCDKLFAYVLARYGQAVLAGEIQEVATNRRGAGRRAEQIARGHAA